MSELAPEEEAIQRAALTRLRNRHHHHLVTTGVARRMLDAHVPVNYMQNADEFTEGTLLFPFRQKVGQIAIGILWGGAESISGSCRTAPQDLDEWGRFLHVFPNADALMLSRLDAHERGYSQATIFAGIQLVRGELEAGIMPLDGIEPDDVVELGGLIREVDERHLSGELSCLEPETLVNLTISRVAPIPLP